MNNLLISDLKVNNRKANVKKYFSHAATDSTIKTKGYVCLQQHV